MKICHVITRMIVGGAQENTLLSLRGHTENNHEAVLVTGPSPGREGELLRRTELPWVRVVTVKELVRELSPIEDTIAFFKLWKFFRQEKFDVVHTHSSKAGIIGRLAARAAGVPVVVHTVHGQAFHPYQAAWKNRLYIFLERIAARCCDRIFAVAQAMVDQCVAAGIAPAAKYQVVYSGMDTAAFAAAKRDPELRKRLKIPPGAIVTATLARLSPQKGYEFVIPAAEPLLKKHPELHFLIIGDGPMFEEFQQELVRKGIRDRFHFAGLVDPAEVPSYLAEADLLWHLSLHEGLPRAVVQALAVGIPVVTFYLDGAPEVVIDGKTGFTVEPRNADDVSEATERLLGDPELRYSCGQAGREMVLRQFDWKRMVAILETEYARLLKSARRHSHPGIPT